MKRELVDDIYKRLLNEDWKGLPPYLKGGQMGMCMFMALYSEYRNCGKARSLSARILPEVIKFIQYIPNRLLDGKTGIAWGMKYLSNNAILEEDDTIRNIHSTIQNECLNYCFATPIYLPEKEYLFSIGIYWAQLFKQEDSLERYIIEERLLALVDECDRQLHCTIKGIYSPKDMPLSVLHSILYFLKKINKEHIDSYQTQKLIESAENVYSKIKSKELLDDYIYHVFIKRTNNLPKNHTANFYLEFLGNLGFYSLLYSYPDIFSAALKRLNEQRPSFYSEATQIIRKENITVETLCGLGFGLLTHTKQDNYEEQ